MMIPYAKAKKAIESLYDGVCTITERKRARKANGSDGFNEVDVVTNQPCRLSFSSFPDTTDDVGGAHALTQGVKLFMDPSIEVKEGSKITVTQRGRTVAYKSSGAAAVYESHQEINLEIFKGWS